MPDRLPPPKPKKPYKLSENDRRFLKILRIAQDVPEEKDKQPAPPEEEEDGA